MISKQYMLNSSQKHANGQVLLMEKGLEVASESSLTNSPGSRPILAMSRLLAARTVPSLGGQAYSSRASLCLS